MTRDTVLAQLAQAKAALAAGDCDRALGAIEVAWDDLGAFSQQLAARHQSPSAALKLHKKIAQVYTAIRQRCTGNALIAPVGARAARGDLLAPTYRPAGLNPDLVAPTFHGMLTEGEAGAKPWLGVAVAGLAAGLGLWMCVRR